jgi:hypothetical protein
LQEVVKFHEPWTANRPAAAPVLWIMTDEEQNQFSERGDYPNFLASIQFLNPRVPQG